MSKLVLTAMDGVAADTILASEVSAQWQRAQAGLVEILRFGAMLLEVRERLEELDSLQQRTQEGPAENTRAFSAGERPNNLLPGGWNKGTGLKAWLKDNCPEINYKTAYGYMCAAAGLRREAQLAADTPLLPLMGMEPVSDARAEKLRGRVQKALAGATLGLLKQAALGGMMPAPMGGAREGAGRPAGGLTPQERSEAAVREMGELLGKIGAFIESMKHRALPAEYKERATRALKDYANMLND